jgi:hypothetical protein
LFPYLVTTDFIEMRNLFAHSDELIIHSVCIIAQRLTDAGDGLSRATRNVVIQLALMDLADEIFPNSGNSFTAVQRADLQDTVVDRIIPVFMDPAPVPPGTRTFVRDCQRLTNAVFWPIVAEVCDLRWTHGPAFSVWAEQQLEVLPEMRDVRWDNPAHWGLHKAHRGFVNAIRIRSYPPCLSRVLNTRGRVFFTSIIGK